MTKRRHIEDPPPDPPRSGAPGPVAFVFALMFGAAFALTADTGVDPRSTYVQVTTSISRTLRSWNLDQRDQLPLRMGDWPSRLLVPANETNETDSSAGEVPAIAVVIDDLGGNVARTVLAIELPANVTLSFLPDPPRSQELSRRAHLSGHEVIVHLPMQPAGGQNPGERALTLGLQSDELQQRLGWALSRVSDYDGVNNHMGSRFTASRADLMPVMRELRARGLFFLDSRTTPKSQVEVVAQEVGVLSGRRDVFLDDERRIAAIERQLSRAEEFARRNGDGIAIGHPYPETLKVLSEWTRTIKERGFRLASLREVLESREARAPTLVSTAALKQRRSR